MRAGGGLPTTIGFTGQRQDGTGLLYYGARYYDPAIGRFASADDIGVDRANPQSRNRYSYVLNNPTRYTDPTGHEQLEAAGAQGRKAFAAEPQPGRCSRSLSDCAGVEAQLNEFGVFLYEFMEDWTLLELILVLEAVQMFANKAGWSAGQFKGAMGGAVYIQRRFEQKSANGDTAFESSGVITFWDGHFNRQEWDPLGIKKDIVHELAHRWDEASGGAMSDWLMDATGGSQAAWCLPVIDCSQDSGWGGTTRGISATVHRCTLGATSGRISPRRSLRQSIRRKPPRTSWHRDRSDTPGLCARRGTRAAVAEARADAMTTRTGRQRAVMVSRYRSAVFGDRAAARTRVPLVLIAAFLCACSITGPSGARTGPPSVPAYPRAGGLQQEARPIANAGTAYTQRFLTADPPQSVFRFYDDYLLKHGWRRAYEWHYTETRACPVYALTVTAIANSEGQTQVTVSWSPEECKRI